MHIPYTVSFDMINNTGKTNSNYQTRKPCNRRENRAMPL